MAQNEPFFTGNDPEANLYLMPQDTIQEAVYDPAALNGPDLPFAGKDTPQDTASGGEVKSQEK